MLKALFEDLKRGGHGEYSLAVLNGDNSSGGKAPAITDAIDLVDDRNRWITGTHEVTVQGVNDPICFNGSLGSYKCLPDHLAPKHPLPSHIGAFTPVEILLYSLEV